MNSCAIRLAKQLQKMLIGVLSVFAVLSASTSPAVAQETPPPTTLTYPKGWTKCADEGGPCWFLGDVRDVAFGGNGNFVYLLAAIGATDNAPKTGRFGIDG